MIGLPQMRLNETDKHLPTVEEIESSLWRFLRKGAPHQAGLVKELRAIAPGSAVIRFETAKQAKKARLQCKLMEQNNEAPKVANRKITLVEAMTDGEKASAKLHTLMMNWVALVYGETAARKFLVAQKEIHLATKVAKQKGKALFCFLRFSVVNNRGGSVLATGLETDQVQHCNPIT